MNDHEINKKVNDEVQHAFIALRYELVNAVLAQDNKIKALESRINSLEDYVKYLQTHTRGY